MITIPSSPAGLAPPEEFCVARAHAGTAHGWSWLLSVDAPPPWTVDVVNPDETVTVYRLVTHAHGRCASQQHACYTYVPMTYPGGGSDRIPSQRGPAAEAAEAD